MANAMENGRDDLMNNVNQVMSETQSLLDSMKTATTEKTAQLREQLQRNLEATRQKLLIGARREFADGGLAGARVDEIAARAGGHTLLG